MRVLREIVAWAPAWLSEINFAKLAKSSTVRVAVTGLSRSGKTVFITSLIHNLLSIAHGPDRLPLLSAAAEGRVKAAKVDASEAIVLPRFPYAANIRDMAAVPPVWPERTSDVSEIEIDVRFVPKGPLARLGADAATLKIGIIDYPGEWLLDLPLLEQSYFQWSAKTVALLRGGLRAGLARDYLAFLREHSDRDPASEDVAKKAHALYRAFLLAARDQHGLNYLQPGRFLCPGTVANDVPHLCFVPLDVAATLEQAAEGTLGALMQQRFEIYKKEFVERFYEVYFRRYARQVVLVDVLRSFMAGPEAFEDTRLALEEILHSFRYGRGGILRTLLRGTRIDKVLLAATKSDHVPQIQRDNLAELLRHVAALGTSEVLSNDAVVKVLPLASVLSTRDDTEEIAGRRVQVVVGRPVGGDHQQAFFVGNVPIRPPPAAAWNSPFLSIPNFEPPAIDRAPVGGIPHINLDAALEYLVGDFLK